MSALPDHEIEKLALTQGVINPYNPSQLSPSSYDVRLDSVFRVFSTHSRPAIDLGDPESYADLTNRVQVEDKFVLHPGEFALGSTEEFFKIPDDILARLDGKSSLGRLGLVIHATAGYIDPGFKGTITLEMSNLQRIPIILRPSILIAQVGFVRMTSPARDPYQGRYQGSDEATESKYQQYGEDQ